MAWVGEEVVQYIPGATRKWTIYPSRLVPSILWLYFPQLYLNSSSDFVFSNGWFEQFLRPFRVSLHCITKTAQSVSEDYRNLIVNRMWFNRCHSPLQFSVEIALHDAIGHYYLTDIWNLNETPLPFEYLSGRTYNPIESKPILVTDTQGGWDKPEASLVLCVFVDWVNRIPSMITFQWLWKSLSNEPARQHSGVDLEFNETAYINEVIFLKYIFSCI